MRRAVDDLSPPARSRPSLGCQPTASVATRSTTATATLTPRLTQSERFMRPCLPCCRPVIVGVAAAPFVVVLGLVVLGLVVLALRLVP